MAKTRDFTMSQRQRSAFEAIKPLQLDLGGDSHESVDFSPVLEDDTPIFNFQDSQDHPIAILESDFYPNVGANVSYKKDSLVLGLASGEMVMVKGQYKLKIIHGSISIDGINIEDESIQINASSITSLPLITSTNDTDDTYSIADLDGGEFKTILEFSNYDYGFSSIGRIQPALKNVFSPNSNQYTFKLITEPEPNTFGNSTPNSWWNAINSLNLNQRNKVLILGNKGSGKSTLSKMILNNLVNNKKVQILDMDPGQPEFTYPLTISLSTLSNPVFGTIIPDLLDFDEHQVEFYGFNTPAVSPLSYFHHLKNLIKNDKDNLSTVINSPGWTKGFGVDIVKYILKSYNLTHIFLLNDHNRELDLLRELEFPDGVQIINLPAFTPDNSMGGTNILTAAKIRTFKMMAPLHKLPGEKKFDFNPLIDHSPLQLSYFHGMKSVPNIMAFNGLTCVTVLDSDGVSSEDLTECLETQMVAIHSVKSTDLEKSISHSSSSVGLPLLLPEPILHSLESKFEAYGCVHSVDRESHIINLYLTDLSTGLLPKVLKGTVKLILVVGRSLVPTEELQWKKWTHPVPYSAPVVSNVAGSKPVVVRRTIQRGRLY